MVMPRWVPVLVGIGGIYVGLRLARPRFNGWGATAEERQRRLPGEEAVPGLLGIASTHAVTIDAPPRDVWPWLVQMGQQHAGFYSYAWLEDLTGCEMPRVGHIVPQWQGLKLGDPVYLHPKAPPLHVTHLDPERVLALEGWMFSLEPVGQGQTRLLARTYAVEPQPGHRILGWVTSTVGFELAHFIMSRKQLLTVKALAEAAAQRQELPATLNFAHTSGGIGRP
jgi:hypothetical protein